MEVIMKIAKHSKPIATLEDWFLHAPPKKGTAHWKDGRSAKELGRYWLEDEAARGLMRVLEPVFGNVLLLSAEPECEIFFDRFGGPRNCDLAIQAKCSRGLLTIHIEAKADESFDQIVGTYVDKMSKKKSDLPERADLLSRALFGQALDERVRRLRYQLLVGAAATRFDAARHGAFAAVCLIQEFRSTGLSERKLKANHEAWKSFLNMFRELEATDVNVSDKLFGPVAAPEGAAVRTPLYFANLIVNLT
jgi:hypothetical protein